MEKKEKKKRKREMIASQSTEMGTVGIGGWLGAYCCALIIHRS
jgi:hypothetical protein